MSADIRLIHDAAGVKFVVVDEVAHTPDDIRRALKRPKANAANVRAANLIAAADALREAAAHLPRVVQTHSLRAALAQYRTARAAVQEE